MHAHWGWSHKFTDSLYHECMHTMRNIWISVLICNQALSINRSLYKAKLAAQSGQISSGALRELVVQAILEAGGKIDYAEVKSKAFCFVLASDWYVCAQV